MELKSRSFTSKEPQVAREPHVADPCPGYIVYIKCENHNTTNNYGQFCT